MELSPDVGLVVQITLKSLYVGVALGSRLRFLLIDRSQSALTLGIRTPMTLSFPSANASSPKPTSLKC